MVGRSSETALLAPPRPHIVGEEDGDSSSRKASIRTVAAAATTPAAVATGFGVLIGDRRSSNSNTTPSLSRPGRQQYGVVGIIRTKLTAQ